MSQSVEEQLARIKRQRAEASKRYYQKMFKDTDKLPKEKQDEVKERITKRRNYAKQYYIDKKESLEVISLS